MSYYHYTTGILLLIMQYNFKDSRRRNPVLKSWYQYLDCATGGVYGLEQWILFWLVADHAVSVCSPFSFPHRYLSSADPLVTQHLLSTVDHCAPPRWSLCKDGS